MISVAKSAIWAASFALAATLVLADDSQPPAPDSTAPTSVTQALQAESGIAVQTLCTNCNNADLSMGALGNDHVEVVCDDMPIASGLGQIYLLSVMPATMLDKVKVRKGAGNPALDGGAVGGVIEFERREPRPGVQVNAMADAGGFGWRGTKVDLSGESGRLGGFLVGSLSQSDLVDANDDGNPDMPSFDRYTVEGAGEVKIGRDGVLGVGLSAYRESQADGPAAYDSLLSTNSTFNPTGRVLYNRENVELDRDQLDASFRTRFGDGSKIQVQALVVDRAMRVEETDRSPSLVIPGFAPPGFSETYLIDETDRHAGAQWARPVGSETILRAGASIAEFEYDIVDRNYNNLASLPPEFKFNERVRESGVWFEAESMLSGSVTVSAGLRWADFDYVDSEDRPQWTVYDLPEGDRILPRAAVSWKPNPAWQLRASGGAGFRAPQPIYEEVCCGRRYRNNRGIETENSAAYGLEATYQPGPKWKIAGAAFVTDFTNRVIKMITLSDSFRPTYQNVNVPEARYASLDLDGRVAATNWLAVKASASWLDASNRSSGDQIPALVDFFGVPETRDFTLSEIPYLPERRGSVGFDLRPPGFWEVGINLAALYTGSMKIQRFEDFPLPELGYDEADFVDTGGFWTASVEASKTFSNKVAVFAGVDNLTDEVQSTLGDPHFDYNWGPLRGRYVYAGARYSFASRSKDS